MARLPEKQLITNPDATPVQEPPLQYTLTVLPVREGRTKRRRLETDDAGREREVTDVYRTREADAVIRVQTRDGQIGTVHFTELSAKDQAAVVKAFKIFKQHAK